jgi:hypothetical protein
MDNTQSRWINLIENQRFQSILLSLIKVSGFVALPIVQRWFPGLTAESLNGILVAGIPLIIGGILDWYRNNPNNIVARALSQINGNKGVSDENKAAVAVVASTLPGVKVVADVNVASSAVIEAAMDRSNNVQLEKP